MISNFMLRVWCGMEWYLNQWTTKSGTTGPGQQNGGETEEVQQLLVELKEQVESLSLRTRSTSRAIEFYEKPEDKPFYEQITPFDDENKD